MKDSKPKTFDDGMRSKVTKICFIISIAIVGLIGASIPIAYVNDHIGHISSIFGKLLFQFTIILFALVFIGIWMVFVYKLKNFVTDLRSKKDRWG